MKIQIDDLEFYTSEWSGKLPAFLKDGSTLDGWFEFTISMDQIRTQMSAAGDRLSAFLGEHELDVGGILFSEAVISVDQQAFTESYYQSAPAPLNFHVVIPFPYGSRKSFSGIDYPCYPEDLCHT